ncbi:AAA family ATPase [Prosthecomicrobium sp. N25]|uniref:AAA family ATPase n=1 Tax=Prosthecomicrobium sp. N25 TaxID=3129254 RepID=UPI003076C6FA
MLTDIALHQDERLVGTAERLLRFRAPDVNVKSTLGSVGLTVADVWARDFVLYDRARAGQIADEAIGSGKLDSRLADELVEIRGRQVIKAVDDAVAKMTEAGLHTKSIEARLRQVFHDEPFGRRRFQAIFGDQARPVLDGSWLVKEVLPARGLGILYGAPGSGKSFFALDLALYIASGRTTWRGKKLHTVRVAYVFAEGGIMAQNRVCAWREEHGLIGDNFAMYPDSIEISHENMKKDVSLLCDAIRNEQGGAELVVIDTLSRAMSGRDENSSVDMTDFIAGCQEIERRLGCLVLVVHHSGKDSTRGSRGHSSLLGAADFEMEVALKDRVRVARLTKLKEGDTEGEFGFTLKKVVLGLDADGEQVTSCVVQPVSEADMAILVPEKQRTLARWEAPFQEAVTAALADHGMVQRIPGTGDRVRMAPLDVVRSNFDECFRSHHGDPEKAGNARRDGWRKARDQLHRLGLRQGKVNGAQYIWKVSEQRSDPAVDFTDPDCS